LRAVEGIKELGAEFETRPLGDRSRLSQREVDIVLGGSAQQSRRRVSKASSSIRTDYGRSGKAVGIEVLVESIPHRAPEA
jgi:hypothetical protein